MIINNSELIKPLLWFPTKENLKSKRLELNADYFYVVQLIQRKKDNPTKLFGNPNHRTNSNRSLYQSNIYSLEDFDEKLPTLIELAKIYQSRVYINPNLKSSYNAYVNLVKNLGCRLETRNYRKLNRVYNEAVGECKGSSYFPIRWIVDIDDHDLNINDYVNEICSLRGGHSGKGFVYKIIPTKNGFHLITSSFNLEEFRKWESINNRIQVDVHKDNPTILWMNTNWSESVGV